MLDKKGTYFLTVAVVLSKQTIIYIYKSHCRFVCLFVCLSALNLRDLKSHDHETWHVGPLNDEELHGLCWILIFGRVAPQAHAACFNFTPA